MHPDSGSEDDLARLSQTFNGENEKPVRLGARGLTKGAMGGVNEIATLKTSMRSAGTLDDMEAEQQRLRESYSQTKQARNKSTNSRSRSGYRARKQMVTNENQATMQARVKPGFGRIYEDQTLQREDLDKTIDQNKENDRQSEGSASKLHNRYKRNTSQNQSISNYQEKYNKLEENFKRFTASLLDKRSSTTNLRASTNQFVPIQSDASPVRKAGTSMTRDVSPTHNFVTKSNIVPLDASQVQQSVATRQSLLGLPPLIQKKADSQSAAFAIESAIAEQVVKTGSSRVQMLISLVARLNGFIDTCFEKLVSLCISKQQEHQVKELHREVRLLAEKCSLSVAALESKQDSDQEQQTRIEEECNHVQQLYKSCFQNLEMCFTQLLSRIYQIESETFKNYKFRDTIVLFETVLSESQRLNLYQLMPSMIEMLTSQRIKTAAGILRAYMMRNRMISQKRRFVQWRSTVGMQSFLSATFREANMSKTIARVIKNWQRRSVVHYLHMWKQLIFSRKQRAADSTHNGGLVETLMLDQRSFADCIESDAKMAHHICAQAKKELGDQFDLILITREDQTQSIVLTGFDPDEGGSLSVNYKAVEDSLTAIAIERELKKGIKSTVQLMQFQSVFGNKSFNEKIDTPFLPKTFLNGGSFQDLNMLVIPLVAQQSKLLGLLRLFSTSKIPDKDFDVYERAGQTVGKFIERTTMLRNQLQTLQDDLNSVSEQLNIATLEKAIHNCVFDILHGLQQGTKQDFMTLLQEKSNILLKNLLPGSFIRQIYAHTVDKTDSHVLRKVVSNPLIAEADNPHFPGPVAMVRQKDHRSEQKDLLEDFLEYKAEKCIHQISINHQEGYTIVLHRDLPKDAFVEVRQGLNFEQKFALSLFARCITPVLQQGITIHDELANQVKLQAKQLFRSVQIHQSREDLRSLLQKLPGMDEAEFCKKFSDAVYSAFRNSELMQNVDIEQFATMINSGLLSGAPLTQTSLIAYLDREQNALLLMPEDLKIEFQDPNALTRYEAPLKDYSQMKQEIKVTGANISIKLPVSSDKALLAVIQLEATVSDEDPDLSSTIQDIKALAQSISIETQKMLTQVIFAQAHQNFQFKDCFDQIQHQLQSTHADLDLMQALQHHLVLPFTMSPSTKMFGHSLTALANKVMPGLRVDAISLLLDGQVAIEDIRLLDWRLLQPSSESKKKQAPVQFKIDEKIINLYLEGDSERRGLLMRLSLTKQIIDDIKETTNEAVMQQCQLFQMIITPFVKAALVSIGENSLVTAKQEQLPRTLSKIVMQRKYGHIYNFFMRLKEHQVNKVPIFTRLRSYRSIIRKCYDHWGIEERIGYDEDDKREFLTRMNVLQTYSRAFQIFEQTCLKTKAMCFYMFRNQIILQIQQEQAAQEFESRFEPTKQQRKAASLIHTVSRKLLLRAFFGRFAVKSKVFHLLNAPQTRAMAAAFCIVYNQQIIKMRRAFQRMRANAANRFFREYAGAELFDRENLTRIAKTLYNTNLASQNASNNLEMSFSSVLDQCMNYLQETLQPEQLDVIVVSLQSANQRKAKAYVFRSPVHSSLSIQRVPEDEAFDGVMTENMNLLTDNLAGLQDFTMSFKRDIILQMLQKSQTMFNFSNVNQSLYDLYLNHLGRSASQVRTDLHRMGHKVDGPINNVQAGPTVDAEVAKRMMLIKKCKSALILPLLVPFRPGFDAAEKSISEQIDYCDDIPEFKVAGSLELYRFHYQPFDEETERRMGLFANTMANEVIPVYFQLRQTQIQIESLQKQISTNSRPINSLSRLLRQVYYNAPTQLNAAQILPIIIEQKTQAAFFFHFRDNHIYNFSYGNTFIGEIVDFKCILELAAIDDEHSEASTSRSQPVTDRDYTEIDQQESVYNQIPSHRKRNINCGRIQSVTNEKYKHILYYPVVSGPLGKIKAVVEVSFNSLRQVPKNVLTPSIQSFLESFSSQLNQLESRLRTFCKFTESTLAKRDSIRLTKSFNRWKSGVTLEHARENYEENHQQIAQQNEQCFNEYIHSLDCYDQELKKLVQIKEETDKELLEVKIDRVAKYKFLGAALILIKNMERRQNRQRVRIMFSRWKYNQNISKIAESAFNKLLELNHRHSQRRFRTACFLMERSIGKIIKREGLENIQKFAMHNHLRFYRQKKISNGSLAFSDMSHRVQTNETLSNVLGPGIITRQNYHSAFAPSQVFSSNGDRSFAIYGSAVPFQKPNNQVSVQLNNTTFLASNTSIGHYDTAMENYNTQMGFGAVPNHVENKSSTSKRNKKSSRSSSQRRIINK